LLDAASAAESGMAVTTTRLFPNLCINQKSFVFIFYRLPLKQKSLLAASGRGDPWCHLNLPIHGHLLA